MDYPGKLIRKTPLVPTLTSASGVWTMTEAMDAVKANSWPVAGTPLPMQQSLRFRASASASLSRTPTVASNRQTWTWSAWVKPSLLTAAYNMSLFGADNGTDTSLIAFTGTINTPTYQINIYNGNGAVIRTTQYFRDPSAWYHIVVVSDTTNATSSNRTRLYVNGSQVTAFDSATYPSQNGTGSVNSVTQHDMGKQTGTTRYFDGYMAEINFVDGQALTPSSFGQTDPQTGVWQAIPYTGTYGTNGFYLPFKNPSNVGLDYSGNANNWTANNISTAAGTVIQTFSTTGTTSWTAPTGVTSVDYLVVGGGGGGGSFIGGGGGAGGMRTGTLTVSPGTSYTVTVGAGGAIAASGGNSVFGSITSLGGGAGGEYTFAGTSGGSGGGGGGTGGSTPPAGGAGTAGQGNAGGTGSGSNPLGGSGGGGAGASGSGDPNTGNGANGGNGSASSISGTSVTYAGGGGGGGRNYDTGNGGSGGTGGGGQGDGANHRATAGTANTGGGGGGCGFGSWTYSAAAGGSGVVIISYSLPGAGSTYDVMADTPTAWLPNSTLNSNANPRANYATLNPLNAGSGGLTNGNLQNNGSGWSSSMTTMSFPATGNYYCEMTGISVAGASQGVSVGILNPEYNLISYADAIGNQPLGYGWYSYGGSTYHNSSGTSYNGGATFTTNDIIGIQLNNGTLTFYKNGVSQGTAYSGITGNYCFAISCYGTDKIALNCGQRPFSYTPPSGSTTLCTYNMSTPTIGATASTTANKVMDVTLYTGTGSNLTVTNSGSTQPDLVWIKQRSGTQSHCLYDSVRGATKQLNSNNTGAEGTYAGVSSFNSNGFSIGTADNNTNGATYVAWQWQAGQGTTSSNTNGSITSTVSVNASAGFSVVTYTGDGNGASTIGHGLGVAPSWVICKNRSSSDNWILYFSNNGTKYYIQLNLTNAASSTTGYTAPTSTVFNPFISLGSGDNYVAYCWTPIAGYSAIGSYTGNGSADGPFVYTGFRPRYVLIKNIGDAGQLWCLHDTSVNPYNQANTYLAPNNSNGDAGSATDNPIDILSNGFKMRYSNTVTNNSGVTMIYMAFAESPFKYSLAR